MRAVNYRFARIDASKEVARSYGNQGTKFAWESAFTGLEECVHPNEEDHLTADVGIAVKQYFQASGDTAWLASKGLPLVLGVADYWLSRVQAEVGPGGKVRVKTTLVVVKSIGGTDLEGRSFTMSTTFSLQMSMSQV